MWQCLHCWRIRFPEKSSRKKNPEFLHIFTMLFNGGLVPTYLMYTGIFHINNTLLAYIVPGLLMSAMNVMLIRTFFATSIPDALLKQLRLTVQVNSRFFQNCIATG